MSPVRYKNRGLRYERVADTIRTQVLDGIYQPGEQLPRQHDLAKQHGVTFDTLKRALDILSEEGYVIRKVGKGTYAALPSNQLPVALIADDDEGVREYFAEALATSDWESVAVDSGQAAIEALEETRFDLVFLDLAMPGITGAETFRHIAGTYSDLFVVIITAYPDTRLMAAALEIGPFAVLKKPCVMEDIQKVLNAVAVKTGEAAFA